MLHGLDEIGSKERGGVGHSSCYNLTVMANEIVEHFIGRPEEELERSRGDMVDPVNWIYILIAGLPQ